MENQDLDSIVRDINFGKHRNFLKEKGIDMDNLYCNDMDYKGQKCRECKYYDNICSEETLNKIFKF